MNFYVLKYNGYFVKDVHMEQESSYNATIMFALSSGINTAKVFTYDDLVRLKSNNRFNVEVCIFLENVDDIWFNFDRINLDLKAIGLEETKVKVRIEEIFE